MTPLSMSDSPAVRRANLIGSTVGRFVVLAQLGEGGMGEVFRARDTKLNRIVAIKRLHVPDRNSAAVKSRMLAEAERASRVNHPNIATVYDVIEEHDEVLLVMEYVEGHTLRSRLHKPITVDEAVRIAAACADALAAAHKHGVIHCDIKPENVMLTADGGVKLLDFGVARTVSTPENATFASRTNSNSFSGTPAYMSPEVLNEQKPDGRSDIFSLGIVLYEMLAGQNPFQTGTMIETANRVIHLDPDPLPKSHPEVPEQVERIVAHAIEKSPSDRYADATEFAHDLRAVASGQAQLVAAPVHQRHRSFRNLVIPAVVALAVFAVAVMSWNYFRPKAPVGQTRLVAVLPFSVGSDDRSAHAFSDGLVETLSAKLSRISDGQHLQVIPAWEVRSQGVTTADQAVKSLGVNLVVEGSLRQVDRNVRVTYTLVDPRTRRVLRGDSITAVMSDPFAVEDKVVDSVLASLQVELQPQQREALNAGRPTEPSAYDFYLQGRGYLQDPQKTENLDSAVAVFQQALSRDPKYALAHAGLGETYWLKFENHREPRLVAQALNECNQAAALAPNESAAHLCLGIVYRGTGKYEQAAQELQHAVQVDSSNDQSYKELARAYASLNRLKEAEDTFKQAIQIRPSYWGAYNQLGVFYYHHGRTKDAVDAFNKATELAPDNFRVYNNLAAMYLAVGDYSNAIETIKKSAAIRPSAESSSNLASAYFFQHKYDKAITNLNDAVRYEPDSYEYWLNLAEAYRWHGGAPKEFADASSRAVELTTAAIKINPKDADALSTRAYAKALAGEKTRSVKNDIESALSVAPNDPNVSLRVALAEMEAGQSSDARVHVQTALGAGLPPSQVRDHPAFDGAGKEPAWQKLLQEQR